LTTVSPLPAELVCFGDISIDTLVSIDHLPRRDEKQWARLIGDFPGGMAANVAVAYARLGGTARLVAHIGPDSRGAAALASLRETAVDISLVTEVDHPTFWTMSLIDRMGERSMVEFASEAIHPDWASAGGLEGAAAAYTIGSETSRSLSAFRRLQSRGTWTVVDADYAEIDSPSALRELLEATTVFFCNSATASKIAGVRSPMQAARLIAKWGPKTVVVTLGRHGALAVDREQGDARVQGFPVEVVDSTGAGDCFAGAFLFARIRKWRLRPSLELANVMAAISTTAYGCQSAVPTRAELLARPEASGWSFYSALEQ